MFSYRGLAGPLLGLLIANFLAADVHAQSTAHMLAVVNETSRREMAEVEKRFDRILKAANKTCADKPAERNIASVWVELHKVIKSSGRQWGETLLDFSDNLGVIADSLGRHYASIGKRVPVPARCNEPWATYTTARQKGMKQSEAVKYTIELFRALPGTTLSRNSTRLQPN